MITIFQLKATGILSGFFDRRSIFSKKVFTHKKKAVEYIPAFRKLVTKPDELIRFDEPVEIDTHELELDASLITIEFGGNGNGD